MPRAMGSWGTEEDCSALGSDILGLHWDLTLWGTHELNSLTLTMGLIIKITP